MMLSAIAWHPLPSQDPAGILPRSGAALTLAAEAQESVGNFAADAANRATGAKKGARAFASPRLRRRLFA